MKSRKFKAVLAAVSAIAVLATAMTGFAAATIDTATVYNFSTGKASVTTTVSGLGNSDAEVTLLVSTTETGKGVGGSGIAYIDQKAASDGSAVFTYQLDTETLGTATAAVVTSGNDAGVSLDPNAEKTLGVSELENISSDGYTVTYDGSVTYVGTETITASFEPVWGKEIESVVVGSKTYDVAFNAVKLTYVDGVLQNAPVVTLKDAEVDIVSSETSHTSTVVTTGIANPEVGKEYEKHTTAFKVTAPVSKDTHDFGVEYNGTRYAATFHPVNQQYVIVQIIAEKGVIDSATPYCEAKN